MSDQGQEVSGSLSSVREDTVTIVGTADNGDVNTGNDNAGTVNVGAPGTLKLLAWNVHGLWEKLSDGDFVL